MNEKVNQVRALFERFGVVPDLEMLALAGMIASRIQTSSDKLSTIKTMMRRAVDDSPRVVQGILED